MRLTWKWKCNLLIFVFAFFASCSSKVENVKKDENVQQNHRIISLTSTVIPYLDKLDCWNKLVAVCNLSYVQNKDYLQKIKKNSVISLGSNQNIDIEKIIALKPSIVFLTSYDREIKSKLDKHGIKTKYFEEFKAQHPMDRFSYIDSLAQEIGEHKKAKGLLLQEQERYNDVLKSVEIRKRKPVVFSGDYVSGYWVCPTKHSYISSLIHDAGGVYPLLDSSSSPTVKIDFERFFDLANKSDYLRVMVYDTEKSIRKVLKQKSRKFELLAPFKRHQIIYSNLFYHDVLGKGIVEPHVLLKEMNALINGESIETKYFHLSKIESSL